MTMALPRRPSSSRYELITTSGELDLSHPFFVTRSRFPASCRPDSHEESETTGEAGVPDGAPLGCPLGADPLGSFAIFIPPVDWTQDQSLQPLSDARQFPTRALQRQTFGGTEKCAHTQLSCPR